MYGKQYRVRVHTCSVVMFPRFHEAPSGIAIAQCIALGLGGGSVWPSPSRYVRPEDERLDAPNYVVVEA